MKTTGKMGANDYAVTTGDRESGLLGMPPARVMGR